MALLAENSLQPAASYFLGILHIQDPIFPEMVKRPSLDSIAPTSSSIRKNGGAYDGTAFR